MLLEWGSGLQSSPTLASCSLPAKMKAHVRETAGLPVHVKDGCQPGEV